MTMKSITREGYELRGANADLWEVAEQHPKIFASHRINLACALGATQDNHRVDASKTLIQALWGRYPELGPYPFLDSLSRFEFERAFYPQYRDHVCHQLKVYLLGLGVYRGCPRLRDAVGELLGGDAEFDLAWLVTGVFHDLGYVIEADDGGPGEAGWAQVTREYETTMRTPFHATRLVDGWTSARENELRDSLRVAAIELGPQSKLASAEEFEWFHSEAKRAGLGVDGHTKHAIEAYYEYAQRVKPDDRPRFRDHGVASALMLTRHWQRYDKYLDDWLLHRDKLDRGADALVRIQKRRVQCARLVQRAAGAMAVHNITPSQWKGSLKEAAASGLDFEKFKIAIARGTDRNNGLAFLLGLVDTLQDWDRPTFGDVPKRGALLGEDLSIRVDGGRVHVHVASDAIEFRNAATSRASRFSKMRHVLTSYLDQDDVDAIVTWKGSDDDFSARFPQAAAALRDSLATMDPLPSDDELARQIGLLFPTAAPAARPDPGLPVVMRGTTVHETYRELQALCKDWEPGVPGGMVIAIAENPDDAQRIPPSYPSLVGVDDAAGWFRERIAWWQLPKSKLGDALNFTHGSNIVRPQYDQVERAIKVLENPTRASRAVIAVLDPDIHRIDSHDRIPSFCTLQLMLRDVGGVKYLDAVAYFRHQELRFWWPVNAAEIEKIQTRALEALQRQYSLRRGRLITFAAVAEAKSSPSLLAVSELDRLFDMEEETLWDMAYALVHPEMPDRENCRSHWDRVIDSLVPPPAADPSKVLVSVHGLAFLVTTLERLLRQRPQTWVENAAKLLRDLLDRNTNHADLVAANEPTKAQHTSWMTGARALAAQLRAVIDKEWPRGR